MTEFFRTLAAYYMNTRLSEMDVQAVHQAKRCVLDTVGCIASSIDDCGAELAFISGMSNKRECTVPVAGVRLNAALAGFAGSVLASAQEMDDATSIGASVHPGCCVIPAALAAAEKYEVPGELFLRAVMFGYDLCNRLGLMATEKIRELGLYGPGFIAAPCAAAVYAMVGGLGVKDIENAFSIAFSMTPVCPFSSFTDGADSKMLYNGWAVYLGILSAEMGEAGLTGAKHILRGKRSMQSILVSDKGTSVPAGEGGFSSAVVFKKYSACLSVHAVLTAIECIKNQYDFDSGEIESVQVEVYPYAYELSCLVRQLNPISARASIPYTAAAMICTGALWPEAFSEETMGNPDVCAMMKRINVIAGTEYGAGPFGKRGAKVTVILRDGSVMKGETDAAAWSAANPPSDDELAKKFAILTQSHFTKQQQNRLIESIYSLEAAKNMNEVFSLLGLGSK